MEIVLKLKPVKSIREMVDRQTKKRKLGLLYFQTIGTTGIVPRVISEQTDPKWLEQEILNYRIFIPQEGNTIAEPS